MKNIMINVKSAVPIYQQIYNQFKKQIMSGEMIEDEPLPSIRSLAKEQKISMVTTKKGFDMLEEEGWIYTVPTKGSFVATKKRPMVKEENLKRLEDMISQIKAMARDLGISDDELTEMIKYIE